MFGGVLGLLVLAFLGYTNKGDLSPQAALDRRKTGNTIGAVVSVLNLLALAAQVIQMFSRKS